MSALFISIEEYRENQGKLYSCFVNSMLGIMTFIETLPEAIAGNLL